MALGNVFIKDVDGNIPYDTGSSGEKVTGLLFDVSLQPTLFTEGYGKTNETRLKPGDVCYITSFKSAVNDFGIIERVEATDEEEMNVNFLHGIPAYHIREFFRMSGNPGGSGKLYGYCGLDRQSLLCRKCWAELGYIPRHGQTLGYKMLWFRYIPTGHDGRTGSRTSCYSKYATGDFYPGGTFYCITGDYRGWKNFS